VSNTDTATVTISVEEPAELAPNQTLTTTQNEPVQVILAANPGGTGTSGSPLKAARVAAGLPPANLPLPDATIAGNVSDANGDGKGDGRDDLPGSTPVFIAAGVDFNLPTVTSEAVTVSGTPDADNAETALIGELSAFTTYDFETASGFPAAGGTIGLFDGINFDAQTASFTSPPSGTQGMTGNGGTFTTASLDFTGLPEKPIAFGFFALDLTTGGEVIRATVNFSDATQQVFDVQLQGGAPSFTPTYFRFIDVSKTIDSISFVGTEVGGTCPGTICRAWLIDDLTIGTAREVAGTARVQTEWDVTSLPSNADEIESCEVTLITNKGSVDSLDTTFFAGAANQNGTLDVTDFEAPVSGAALALMPVSIGVTGTDVPFSFDVTGAVKSARTGGFSFFSISGRVNEALAGTGFQRGLQIRSSASGNQSAGTEPQLTCVTTGTPTGPQLTWTILTVPTNGLLLDPAGNQLFGGETFTSQPTLTFISPTDGTFSFAYRVTEGGIFDDALVTLVVQLGDDCLINGRDPGCSP
jgi:hypothetical protein